MGDEYPADAGGETWNAASWTAGGGHGIVGGMSPDWHQVTAGGTASGAARRHVAEWLRVRGAATAEIDDLSLAASELAANVVQHGDADELFVRLDDHDPTRWTLEVRGGRRPLPDHLADPSSWSVAGPDSPHGRGLGIVRTVVDDVEVSTDGDVLAIRCHRLRAHRD